MTASAVTTASDDSTLDGFHRGAFHLVQPQRGHRAGMDAMMLAASAPGVSFGAETRLAMSVSTNAGMTPTTSVPRAASSARMACVRENAAAFDAL